VRQSSHVAQDRVGESLRGAPIRQVIALFVADQRAASTDVQEVAGQVTPPRAVMRGERFGFPEGNEPTRTPITGLQAPATKAL